jgi:hypothetical protein
MARTGSNQRSTQAGPSRKEAFMKLTTLLGALALLVAAAPAPAQETPETLVATYDKLADAILGVEGAEEALVRSVLTYHDHAAGAAMAAEESEDAAAHMALFANEGDNAVAGIRKRLLEGGHHHHAEEAGEGEYEPGFVVVTREAKDQILAAATALRRAGDDAARQAAWGEYEAVATKLLEQ